jgi:ABC-type multidrug transport system fused ATPase/permease subunit
MRQNAKSIEFKNVSLKYLQNHPSIIEKVSFSIKRGEKVGIIGRTGSGKSTLFNSLLRVIDPSEG